MKAEQVLTGMLSSCWVAGTMQSVSFADVFNFLLPLGGGC